MKQSLKVTIGVFYLCFALTTEAQFLKEKIDSISRQINESPTLTAYILRGQMKQVIGDTLGALADFSNAISIAPDSIDGYNHRAMLRRQLKDYSRANADFTKAIFLNSNLADLYFGRAVVRLQLAEYPDAVNDFTVTLEKDTTVYSQYNCLLYRGICYDKQNLDSLALADFTHALQIAKTAEAHLRRALIYKKQKKYDRAETELTESIKIKASAEAYFERGSVRMATGERVAGYLDMVKARSLGGDAAEKFLAKYEQEAGSDTLRFYNTPEIIVEAQTELFKSAAKEIKTTIDIGKRVIAWGRGGGTVSLPTTFSPSQGRMPTLFDFTNMRDCNSGIVQTARSSRIHILCIARIINDAIAGIKDKKIIQLARAIYNEAEELTIMQISADPSLPIRAPIMLNNIQENMERLQARLLQSNSSSK
jgi:tetratricopeptide (TPR) repeat protein